MMGIISKPYVFYNGTTADAEQVNANFDKVINEMNGNLDEKNISTNAQLNAVTYKGNDIDTDGDGKVDSAVNADNAAKADNANYASEANVANYVNNSDNFNGPKTRLRLISSGPIYISPSSTQTITVHYDLGESLLFSYGIHNDTSGMVKHHIEGTGIAGEADIVVENTSSESVSIYYHVHAVSNQ